MVSTRLSRLFSHALINQNPSGAACPQENQQMGSDERHHEPGFNNYAPLTRRGLFEFAGLTIASSVFPFSAAAAKPHIQQDQPLPSPAISPLMERLSNYMSQAATHSLPEEIVEKARHHVLDTFAAMISGS